MSCCQGKWTTCGDLEPMLNRTACPRNEGTCCQQRWSPSEGTWGCSTYVNATCCTNGYTACPSGYVCKDKGTGWSVVTTCEKDNASSVLGQQVCKQGAPLPFDPTRKTVLVLGDSVSIGYTPYVASALSSTVFVQHTPWGGDGGAEETKYGNQCLDYLLRAPDGTELRPDLLFFNFGLHNVANSTVPGQSGPINEYLPYLKTIASRLKAWATADDTKQRVQLLFALTSPMLNDPSTDDIILAHNAAAKKIMDTTGIPTVDLHDPIVQKCGPVPEESCFGQKDCWSPHCPPGYSWLANDVVVPAIERALSS